MIGLRPVRRWRTGGGTRLMDGEAPPERFNSILSDLNQASPPAVLKFVTVKQYLHLSFFLFIALTISSSLCAQVNFTAKVNAKEVGTGDILELDFVIDGVSEVEQFMPPAFNSFQVVQGPSYTSGFNMINGTTSKYYSVTYFLKPSATGKFAIGPASAMVNNQVVRSNAVNVEVVKGSTGNSAAPAANPFQGMPSMDPFNAPSREPSYGDQYLRKSERAEDKVKHNMQLKMLVNKTSCYVGEPIVATCKLYSRLESESKVVERPTFSGFSVFEMVQPEQGSVTRESLNGRPFNGYLIRKAQLYPLQSGDLSIEPVELDNSITFFREGKSSRSPAPAGSVFDQVMRDFMGDGEGGGVPEKHQINLSTDSVVIHVKPLPEAGKPADFSGAVGQFTLQASLAGTSLKTNETDTLILTLTGSGNLPMVNAPALHLPPGLEAYDPSAKEQLDQSVSPIRGRKIFQYIFTAGKVGDFTVPPVSLSYFDPQTATYKTVATAPLLLNVTQGSGSTKGVGGLVPEMEHSSYWKWSIASLLVLGLAIGGWMGWKRIRKRKEAAEPDKAIVESPSPKKDNAPSRSIPIATPAPAAATLVDPHAGYRPAWDMKATQLPVAAVTTFDQKDWLEEARIRLKEQNSVAYYRSLNAGLWHLLQQYLDIHGGERNKTAVLNHMEKKGFGAGVRGELAQLLEECEMALYAPVQTASDMQRSMEVAERLQKRFIHDLRD